MIQAAKLNAALIKSGEIVMLKRITQAVAILLTIFASILPLSGCLPVDSGGSSSSSGYNWTFIIFLVIIGVIFYFFMIRPQRTRQNQRQKLLNELKPGDRVITIGGVYGQIESIDEQSVVLKVEDGGKIRFSRQSIATILSQ